MATFEVVEILLEFDVEYVQWVIQDCQSQLKMKIERVCGMVFDKEKWQILGFFWIEFVVELMYICCFMCYK